MRKETLRKLRGLNVTPGMISAAKDGKCLYYARAQCLGAFIKIAIFPKGWILKGIKTPAIETFINKEGKEWISRTLNQEGKEEKWTEAMIYNLPMLNGLWYWARRIWVTKDTFETAKRFNKNWQSARNECLDAFYRWQQDVREENILEKEKREQKPWDEDMALVPETPKGLEVWMHRQCCEQFYLVYEYKPNQKIAYCTRCWKMVQVDGLKNNVKKICPSCGAKAVCKSSGQRMARTSTETYYARVIQKIQGGVVERVFTRREVYGRNIGDIKWPFVAFQETKRILILENQKPKIYYWTMYKNKFMRWVNFRAVENWKNMYFTYGKEHAAKTYPATLAAAMKTNVLKKSSYGLWKNPPVELHEYVAIEKGNPAVEMLARINMFRLAEDLIKARYDQDLMKEDATELTKMLKIDAARLKRLRKMDAGIAELRWMQREKQSDCIWPDELISDFGKNNVLPKDLTFLPHGAMSEVQIWNYLKKQEQISGEDVKTLLKTWDDYLSMAGTMKMDVNNSRIYKPKELRFAHDELVILRSSKGMAAEAKKIEKKFPKVNAQLQKLKKFEYKNGKYQILAPAAVMDIVREGRVLQHCVHTCEHYFSRIQSDESYLFFLRRSAHPDVPWYTLEVEPSGNIRQKRTTGDRQNKDFEDAVEFLKKWQKHFQRQLTKEEKELGIKADELRKKNYKELREQAKIVWHGPLAGQLLADVLEADFMEAI